MGKSLFLVVSGNFPPDFRICFGVFVKPSLFHHRESFGENSSFPEEREATEKSGNPALLSLDFTFAGTSGLSFVSVLTKNIQLIQGEDFAKGLESVLLLLKSFYEDLNQRVSEIPIAGNDLQEGIRTFLAKLLSFVQNLGSNFLSSVGNMGSLIGTLLFGIIFSIYFLADGVKIALYWERILRLILGEKRVLVFRGFLKDADRAFSGYIRGQMIDGIIMAILVSTSLSLIGVRYALAIGILTGIGNLIPYVGPFVAYGTTILVCALYGDFAKLLPAVLAVFVIQTIDGNVINPRLLSNSIDIHPLLVIISLIIGGAVGGVLGIFLAAPIASLIKLQVDRMVERGEAKKKAD